MFDIKSDEKTPKYPKSGKFDETSFYFQATMEKFDFNFELNENDHVHPMG